MSLLDEIESGSTVVHKNTGLRYAVIDVSDDEVLLSPKSDSSMQDLMVPIDLFRAEFADGERYSAPRTRPRPRSRPARRAAAAPGPDGPQGARPGQEAGARARLRLRARRRRQGGLLPPLGPRRQRLRRALRGRRGRVRGAGGSARARAPRTCARSARTEPPRRRSSEARSRRGPYGPPLAAGRLALLTGLRSPSARCARPRPLAVPMHDRQPAAGAEGLGRGAQHERRLAALVLVAVEPARPPAPPRARLAPGGGAMAPAPRPPSMACSRIASSTS